MGRRDPAAIPAVYVWLVQAIAWLVPSPDRAEWRRSRTAQAREYRALLGERGGKRYAVWSKLAGFLAYATRDAWRTRFPEWEPLGDLRRRARSPWALAAYTAVFLAAVALASGGFRAVRTLRKPLPYLNPGQLVTCYQVHFASMSLGVQARYVAPWRRQSEALSGVEAYSPRRVELRAAGASTETVDAIRVTPGFFDLLGVTPTLGDALEAASGEAEPRALVGWDYWKRRLGGDPAAVGRRIWVEGQPARIAGVLPEGFWFRSPQVAVWTLLPDLEKPDPALRLVSMIGRLKPGATPEGARAELQQIAYATSRFRGGAFRVAPLQRSLGPSLQIPLLVFLGGVALAVTIALVQTARSVRREGTLAAAVARYWLFFAGKVVLVAGAALAVEVELAAANALNPYPSRFVFGLLLDWASVVFVLLMLRWAMLDQSRRCPVCLRSLGVPVSSGSWSSPLLAPATTEMLCDQGHGALTIAETESSFGEIRRWIAMEDSWRELLALENNTK